MSVKQMVKLALFSSICVALRMVFGGLPNVKPITAIFLICLTYFKFWEVLIIMGLTMLVTSFYLGFGLWVLWQLLAYTAVLSFWRWGVKPLEKRLELSVGVLAVLAGVTPFIYSFIIGFFDSKVYGYSLWAYWLNGLGFDAAHALSTIAFYPIISYSFRRLFYEEKVIS